MGPAVRRLLAPVLFAITVIVLLATTHFVISHKFTILTLPLEEATATATPTQTPDIIQNATTVEAQRGENKFGKLFHVVPSPIVATGLEGCEYPILIHVTPDLHCTGALALYGSIVRNTIMQPKELQDRTCVHFTYVDPALKSIQDMYKWPARPNPFKRIADCAALDTSPDLNAIVPVRWQALPPIDKPTQMNSRTTWVAALNKVHSWGFDLYPRILLLDADSILITDLHKIFQESPTDITISGVPDQYANCLDRSRLNGGMILLRPSRYFHIVVTELLYDPVSSCLTGDWGQSEQELLNCICGYTYHDRPAPHPLRPEFRCAIMPIYNSLWPKNYACSDANVLPMRSVHFTDAAPKPWLIKENLLDGRFDTKFWKCVRDASRAKNVEGLKKCSVPALEVTRKVGMESLKDSQNDTLLL